MPERAALPGNAGVPCGNRSGLQNTAHSARRGRKQAIPYHAHYIGKARKKREVQNEPLTRRPAAAIVAPEAGGRGCLPRFFAGVALPNGARPHTPRTDKEAMRRYLAKRLASAVPVLFIVSAAVFSLTYLIPGDPAAMILGDDAAPEDIAALRARMGLEQPPVPRYLHWAGNMLRGDFGVSTAQNAPVARLIAERVPPTLSLALYAMLFALALALPLGMAGARAKGSALDRGASAVALAGISIPSFLLGMFLILAFAVRLRWFPVAGFKPLSAGFGAHIRSLTLPAVALGFMYAALIMRMTRAALLETLSSGYILMARAKGAGEFSLVAKHAFRNALVPILTVAGHSFVGALSGATVVEHLFGVPGIGSLVASSVGRRDYQVIQAVVLLVALLNVLVNLLVDVLYGLADPRIRLSD